MGFNFGAALAGFAERDMELRDEARKEAKELASATLKYRTERAMEEEAERKKKIQEAKKFATSLKTKYQFNNDQIYALAKDGLLEDTYNTYANLTNKGLSVPKASDYVQVRGNVPKGKTYDEYLSEIVGGVATTVDINSLYKTKDADSERSVLQRLFNPDYNEREFKKAEESFSNAFGIDVMQKYEDSGEYADIGASINTDLVRQQLDSLRDEKDKFTGLTVSQMNGLKKNTADVIDTIFNTKSSFDNVNGIDIYLDVDLKGQEKQDYLRIQRAVETRVSDIMRDGKVTYSDASLQVRKEMDQMMSGAEDRLGQRELLTNWAYNTLDIERRKIESEGDVGGDVRLETIKTAIETDGEANVALTELPAEKQQEYLEWSRQNPKATSTEKATKIIELSVPVSTAGGVDGDNGGGDGGDEVSTVLETHKNTAIEAGVPENFAEMYSLVKVALDKSGVDLNDEAAVKDFLYMHFGKSDVDPTQISMTVEGVLESIRKVRDYTPKPAVQKPAVPTPNPEAKTLMDAWKQFE